MSVERNLRAQPSGVTSSFFQFAGDIKIVHSVFALPFAASALVFADIPMPSLTQGFLLLVCMVAARSFAMGMNRYLDREIDAKNPRTSIRKIPSGALTSAQSLTWSLVGGVVFILAAFALNATAGVLSVPVLLILGLYPLWKNFSWFTHWYLGFCLGLAPIAVCIALGAKVTPSVFLIAGAVTLWTAGFDILYSLQDWQFDREHRLHSVPAAFGPRHSLYISRGCFVLMIGLLSLAGYLAGAGFWYCLGLIIIASVLTFEHILVRDARHDGNSKHINAAFFNANASVSLIFITFTLVDAGVRGGFFA